MRRQEMTFKAGKAMARLRDVIRLVPVYNGDESSLAMETSSESETEAGNSSSSSSETITECLPMVFFCAKCKRILGDSTCWETCDPNDQVVMLRHVSPFVDKFKEPAVALFPEDHGCISVSLFCSGCSSRVGKTYISTPKHLDFKRGLFCLDVDAIGGYEMGSTTVQEIAQEDEPLTLGSRSKLEAELKEAYADKNVLQEDISTLISEYS